MRSDWAHEELVVGGTCNSRERFKDVGEIRAVPIVGLVRESIVNVVHKSADDHTDHRGGDVVASNGVPLRWDAARTSMAKRLPIKAITFERRNVKGAGTEEIPSIWHIWRRKRRLRIDGTWT